MGACIQVIHEQSDARPIPEKKRKTMNTDEWNTRKPETIDHVKTKWTWDFDNLWHEMKSIGVGDRKHTFGEEGRYRLKGRCRHCWGGLIGKGGAERVPEAIRCRVCGLLLEGDDAAEEYERMSKQSNWNTFNMALGLASKYHDEATFVQKIFPHIDRQRGEEFHRRTSEEAAKGPRAGWLTRSEFPGGSAGFLILQARALMSGVERLPRELSVARFDVSKKKLNADPSTSKNELMERMGSTMTVALMSAFACELTMKGIRLTRLDEARKSHDLWRLYRDLPNDSQARIEEDFLDAGVVLKSARHTFDKWRYFEANVGGRGIGTMIDTQKAFDLAKVARVLLDEAEMMGLGYSVNVEATQTVTDRGDRDLVHVKHNMRTTSTEAPPQKPAT